MPGTQVKSQLHLIVRSKKSPSKVFSFNFLAIIPLAWLIGKATEANVEVCFGASASALSLSGQDVAARIGETAGGLLNATFGNVVWNCAFWGPVLFLGQC